MDVILEMRIRIPMDLKEIDARKIELRRLVSGLDPRPAFFTAERWLVEASDLPPVAKTMPAGQSDWMSRGRTRRAGKQPLQ